MNDPSYNNDPSFYRGEREDGSGNSYEVISAAREFIVDGIVYDPRVARILGHVRPMIGLLKEPESETCFCDAIDAGYNRLTAHDYRPSELEELEYI